MYVVSANKCLFSWFRFYKLYNGNLVSICGYTWQKEKKNWLAKGRKLLSSSLCEKNSLRFPLTSVLSEWMDYGGPYSNYQRSGHGYHNRHGYHKGLTLFEDRQQMDDPVQFTTILCPAFNAIIMMILMHNTNDLWSHSWK